MKKDIEEIISRCEECCIISTKKDAGKDFVTTHRKFEKMTVDIMNLNEENNIVLILIDYFTRFVKMKIIQNRKSETIIGCLEEMFKELAIPEMLVFENEKEFTGKEFKQ